jgi:sterol 24-C-methyltransferase
MAAPPVLSVYRLQTAWRSLRHLYALPSDSLHAFLSSYALFEQDNVGDVRTSERQIRDYYSVLNHLCAVGQVEKMYIPPLLDVSLGIHGNQELFEKRMARDIGLVDGFRVLDVGCGRGRVVAHLSSLADARFTGINIDPVQLESAIRFAGEHGLADRCQFLEANFNDPLPFPDDSFDALFQIQVLTYARDKEALFREMFRVLRPGARLSFLDWVRLPAYDPADPHHASLLRRIKPLIGAVETPSPPELNASLERAGFEVVSSGDLSLGGHQAALIEQADVFYNRVRRLVDLLAAARLLPRHLVVLFERLTRDGDAFVEADRLGLTTSSHQTVARKA